MNEKIRKIYAFDLMALFQTIENLLSITHAKELLFHQREGAREKEKERKRK